MTFLIIGGGTCPCEVVDDGRGWGESWGTETCTDTVPGDNTLAVAGVDTAMGAGVVVIAVLLNTRLELVVLVKTSIFGGDGGEGGSGLIDPKRHCGVSSEESPFTSSAPGS